LTESHFSLRDIAATERLGRAFAEVIKEKAVIALNGPLGVGKTRFTQALAEAIGVDEVVNSPTFTMLNEYHSGRLPLYHFDLYRLSEGGGHTAAEMLEAELSEILSGNYLVLIEWAELLEKPELSEINFLRRLDHLSAKFSYQDLYEVNAGNRSSSLYKENQARLVRIQSHGTSASSILGGVLAAVPELVCK
jgi:tRNA threonylcarbamoyl adenosine modification protein YjeE